MNPESLKNNIIVAAVYISAFEMLKDSIINRLVSMYVNSYDVDNGKIVESIDTVKYENEILSLNKRKSPVYASLEWLKQNNAITEDDVKKFDTMRECRNALAHELHKHILEGLNYDVPSLLAEIVALLDKIETWWIRHFDLAVWADANPHGDDIIDDEIVPGPIRLKMLIEISLAPENEAQRYYDMLKTWTLAK
ncbi:MAG: hypothetical protein R2932_06650 [Caldilineaceae bacterium]